MQLVLINSVMIANQVITDATCRSSIPGETYKKYDNVQLSPVSRCLPLNDQGCISQKHSKPKLIMKRPLPPIFDHLAHNANGKYSPH